MTEPKENIPVSVKKYTYAQLATAFVKIAKHPKTNLFKPFKTHKANFEKI